MNIYIIVYCVYCVLLYYKILKKMYDWDDEEKRHKWKNNANEGDVYYFATGSYYLDRTLRKRHRTLRICRFQAGENRSATPMSYLSCHSYFWSNNSNVRVKNGLFRTFFRFNIGILIGYWLQMNSSYLYSKRGKFLICSLEKGAHQKCIIFRRSWHPHWIIECKWRVSVTKRVSAIRGG